MKTTFNNQNTRQARNKAATQALSYACLCFFSLGQAQAQTCNPNITANTPDSRFEVLASGSEVKDKQTGLIWQRCSLGQTWDATANSGKGSCTGTASSHNWKDALTQAKNLGNGYRLPNITELQSIVERKCYSPAINATIFPNTPMNDYYWSSSPYATSSSDAWVVYFGSGHGGTNAKYNSAYVRAVSEGGLGKSQPKK